MKKIKVTSEVYIFCNVDIASDELAFATELALNSMGTLEIKEGPVFAPNYKAAVRFHFNNEPPEVIIGKEDNDRTI